MIDNAQTLFSEFTPLRRIVSGIAALLFALCVGCSSNPFANNTYPPVPESQRDIDVDYDYIIGPGDSVSIFVWGNEELSTDATIRPDGKMTTHLVEDIQASGRTSTQLARDRPRFLRRA
jgi:polysaccharide biosynthesis/export protein